MDNATSLIATSVSAVVIIALMATYVQIMNYLDDKRYWLPGKMRERKKSTEKINEACNKIRFFLKLLTLQGLLFFASVFLLLFITGTLISETLRNRPVILSLSLLAVIVLSVSQIFHCVVFCKSYWKFVSKRTKPRTGT